MQMKKQNLLKITIFLIICFFTQIAYAGEQEWKSLNYDVQINSDGSMDAVTAYNDCSELYWMFVSDENALSFERIKKWNR